jgi:hypothetical protein
LDFIKNGRAKDISDLIDNIKRLALLLIDEKSRILIFRTFLSRFYLLTLLFGTKQVRSPKEWLLLQLDNSIQDTLKKIKVHLQQFTWDGMYHIFLLLKDWLYEQNHSIIVAIDEANVLLVTLGGRSMGDEICWSDLFVFCT